jgi:phosphatidylglycerophosphate synthase
VFDARLRPLLAGPLDRLAAAVDRPWVTPDRVTLLGLVLGLGSAVAAALAWWPAALALWLASRLADGLDGPLARRRGPRDAGAGGFLDITCDFLVYGGTVVGVALGSGGPLWPFLLVLLAYYVNGTAFLAFSSIAERSGRRIDDGRSLSFLGGLAEGAETVAVHALWLVLPFWAGQIAVVWAGLVAVSAAQRVVAGYRALR